MREWREPFCVLCGRTMGIRNITPDGKPWIKLGEVNRWKETLNFTGDKPFGVIKSSEGRGTMKFERYYDINEDAEGYFPLIKQRLLNVITEWVEKRWLTKAEVRQVLKRGGE